jgi:DNA-binding GntR family transcriptional regulator
MDSPSAPVVNVGSAHRPLRDVVATEMRRLILDGTLRPGERLIEDRLAERLGPFSARVAL